MKENGTLVKLEASDCKRDLGVYVDTDSKPSKHVEIASNKANRIMGMIKCLFTCIDKEMVLCLFRRLERPHLKYSNAVWSLPWYLKDVEITEKVQKRASRVMVGLKNLGYWERLEELQLPFLI